MGSLMPDGSSAFLARLRSQRSGKITDTVTNAVLSRPLGYRLYLGRQTGALRPRGYPTMPARNGALKSRAAWEQAVSDVEALGLPRHVDRPKNWDSLLALRWILQSQNHSARILDAGAETYSVILPWLFLYGYRHLTGINLTFDQPMQRGRIRYQFGDITATNFESNSVQVITCLSVIEHGVNPEAYFREAARLLKPGGMLITSFDYYPEPIDTHGKIAYGVPVKIFSRQDVSSMLEIARGMGLQPLDTIDMECPDKPVHWESQNLDYTFFALCLWKRPTHRTSSARISAAQPVEGD